MEFGSGWLKRTVPPEPTEKLFQLTTALPVFWSMTVLLALGLVIEAVPSTTWPPVGWARAAESPMTERQLVPRRSARRIAVLVGLTALPDCRHIDMCTLIPQKPPPPRTVNIAAHVAVRPNRLCPLLGG